MLVFQKPYLSFLDNFQFLWRSFTSTNKGKTLSFEIEKKFGKTKDTSGLAPELRDILRLRAPKCFSVENCFLLRCNHVVCLAPADKKVLLSAEK